MVQLPDLSLLAVAALFWATYWVLRQSVFRPIGGILVGRETASAGAVAALEKALASQKETLALLDRRLLEARREAMVETEKFRAEASRRRQELLDIARERARAQAAEAQKGLDAEVAAAREELRRGADALAAEIASRALGRAVA